MSPFWRIIIPHLAPAVPSTVCSDTETMGLGPNAPLFESRNNAHCLQIFVFGTSALLSATFLVTIYKDILRRLILLSGIKQHKHAPLSSAHFSSLQEILASQISSSTRIRYSSVTSQTSDLRKPSICVKKSLDATAVATRPSILTRVAGTVQVGDSLSSRSTGRCS